MILRRAALRFAQIQSGGRPLSGSGSLCGRKLDSRAGPHTWKTFLGSWKISPSHFAPTDKSALPGTQEAQQLVGDTGLLCVGFGCGDRIWLIPNKAGEVMPHSRRIISEALSPIMIVAALVLPLVVVGMTEASTTRRPPIPFTRSFGSTTASASEPIRQVQPHRPSEGRCGGPKAIESALAQGLGTALHSRAVSAPSSPCWPDATPSVK